MSDVDSGHTQVVIRVTDEEHCLGIEFVGKQELGEDGLGSVRNREYIQLQIP